MKKPQNRHTDETANFYESMPIATRSGMPWGHSEYSDTEEAKRQAGDQAMRRLAVITLVATVVLALVLAALFAAGMQMIATGFAGTRP